MRFVCDKCHTSLSYPDDKITKNKIRYTCIKCGNVGEFSVNSKSESKDVAENSGSSNLNKWHATTLNTPRRSSGESAWYYSYDGTSRGPYSEEALCALFQGELSDIGKSCHVWCRALENWKPAAEVEPFASALIMPPPPPAPVQRVCDENLPPLFGGKSGLRSSSSSPNAARASSPDLASLKQRLKTETHLSHEAPTHQAMPALESLVRAESEIASEDSDGETTKVGAVSPFFAFRNADESPSDGAGAQAAGDEDIFDILDKETRAAASRTRAKTDAETGQKAHKSLPNILGAAKSASPVPLFSASKSSSSLGAAFKAGASSPKTGAAFGASEKPAPGIASIFGNSGNAPNLSKLSQCEDKLSSQLGRRNPGDSSLPGAIAGDVSDSPRFSGLRHAADAAASKSVQALTAVGADGGAEGDKEQYADFKEDLGDILNAGRLPDANRLGINAETDGSMSDWLSSKTNLPSFAERTESEMSLAAISFDDNGSLTDIAQKAADSVELNAHADEKPAAEAPLPEGAARAQSASDFADSIQSQPSESDAPDAAIGESDDSSSDLSIPDISLDKSAASGAVSCIPDISLDAPGDASGIPGVTDGLRDTSGAAGESIAAEEALSAAIDGETSNIVQESDKTSESDASLPSLDAFSIDDPNNRSNFPPGKTSASEDAGEAPARDGGSEISEDAGIVAGDAGCAARVLRSKSAERRNALLNEILEEEPEDEEHNISEESQLINLRHYEEMARLDKRKNNKRIAAVAVFAIVACAAIVFAQFGKDNAEATHAPTIVGASDASFESVSGRAIADEDIDRMIPADDFEIYDAHAEEAAARQQRVREKSEAAADQNEAAAEAAADQNEAAAEAIYGAEAQADQNAETAPLRKDGRAGVELQKQEFAKDDAANGSKAAKSASPMQEQFKLGLSAISRSVQECHRREAKNGTMNISKLYIRFDVEPSGAVEKFVIENDGVPETFSKCIDSKKNRWKFMPFEGKTVSLRQGFVLN